MRLSKLFFKTERQPPADAEIISHKLLARAGMIYKVASGIYSYSPLALKVLKKIENIIRDEMDGAGAQELLMPALQPASLWKKTNRWQKYGPEMMRLKDRNDRDFCLGPTHEELITTIVSSGVNSYKQLPLNMYQIQVKFRDEIRPRFGLLRVREFHMKDGYSFDRDEESMKRTYDEMYKAYERICKRCDVPFRAVESESGIIGGDISHEFMVLAETGEEKIAFCTKCDWAANVEIATYKHKKEPDQPLEQIEKVHTPNKMKVFEVAKFMKVSSSKLVKTIIYDTGKGKIAVLIPGKRNISNSKLSRVLGEEPRLIAQEEFSNDMPFGFVGPVGLEISIYVDNSVKDIQNFVIGANEKDYHFKNANTGRDFNVDEYFDLVEVEKDDICPKCGGTIDTARGIEVGNIFQLGTKYSAALDAKFTDEDGSQKNFTMGCYGIGVGRLMAAIVEVSNDENGIIWPDEVSPYDVIILQIQSSDGAEQTEVARNIYKELNDAGISVLYDDRDERAGVKFSDADLIGIPVQVIVGKKVADGKVELKIRKTGERQEVDINTFHTRCGTEVHTWCEVGKWKK